MTKAQTTLEKTLKASLLSNLYAPQKHSQFPWQKNVLPIDLTRPDLWPDLQPETFILDPP